MAEPPPPDDPAAIDMDFELNARRVVEQAARTRTTIQEAPGIVTVITAAEIRDRGYRTLNDVLRSIPGFEGDRLGFNGWFRDPMPRGVPGTTLVLIDGVNIVDPTRNMISLDRKIPLDVVERVEVISGPGGVLWGSNALLGVVNVVTRSGEREGRDEPRGRVAAGGGDGPGARASARGHASFGGTADSLDLGGWVGVTWYTTRGPELTVDQQKLLGPFSSPAPDGLTLLAPQPTDAAPFARDHFVNVSGRVRWGPVSAGFLTGWETETREIGTGGSVLTDDRAIEGQPLASADGLVARGSDPVHVAWLRYRDRYLASTVGLHLQAQMVQWDRQEVPFGLLPRSTLLPRGGTTHIEGSPTRRFGFVADVDWSLPGDHHLLFGAEVMADLGGELQTTYFHPLFGADVAPQECPAPFTYHPGRDAERPCSVRELALSGTQRTTAGVYLSDEWKIGERLAIRGGVRGQFASTYAPAVVLSGAAVVQLVDRVFLKANYAEGFRPPDFQSTAETRGIAAGVTFQANPDLEVERSRAAEVELNAVVAEHVWPLRQIYLRSDYSYTRMENVITFPAGRFENSGVRDIHSVELLSKLVFYGGHEFWMSYYFVDVVDSELGRLRNIANHTLNAGGRLRFFDGKLNLMSLVTVRGSMQDLNRTAFAPTPLGAPLDVGGAAWVAPTGLEVTRIPTAVLWRIGLEGRDLWKGLEVGVWVYNALDVRTSDPDLFFDDRVLSRPQPREGLSVYAEVGVRF